MSQEVFKVVRGNEATILQKTPMKGYVFFATDTRKIYYGDGESFLPMGGNTGVWYGTMVYAETPDESQVEFNFEVTDLENNTEDEYSLPNIDDLIFNTPDGCFYRVIEIEEGSELPSIKCNKLTVAGSGTGGGGGGTNVGLMTLTRLGEATINTLQGNDCYIRFSFSATDASGEATGQGTASVYVGGLLQQAIQINQGENSINVGPYLELGTNSIKLVVSGDIGGSSNITQSKTWTVISTNLSIVWDYDETTINTDDDITFRWTVSTVLNHTIHIDIDGYKDVITQYYEAGSSRDKIYTVLREDIGLVHGSHLVTMYATTEIGNMEFHSNSVSHKIICVTEGFGDTIISVGDIPSEMNQYDTLSIPLVFYNPLNSDGLVTATLFEDGIEQDKWVNYENGKQYYWNYTPTTSGSKFLTITSGTSEVVIRLTVYDLGLTVEEVPGYEFKFKASDIISNNVLQNWSQGSIVPTFSENFDWTNGGLQTELDDFGNPRNYVCVKIGNRLSFNYKPFSKPNSSIISNGFCIKVIFKVTECRSYDASILTIGDSTNDQIYFQLKANEGKYEASGASVTIPYCEDSYIELEIDLWPYGNGGQAYLMSWLDGVPSTVSTYSSGSFFQQPSPSNIVIGSDECDVQIYMIKVYQSHLTNEQHLSNFIIDAPNATEVIARYNRNNILNDNGEISYTKLIEKNPNCDVYLYEMDHMTTHKKNDKVKGCTYRRYHGSTIPLQTAENVTMSVQGTSSAAYGLAAFNFDSEFVDGFTDYSINPSGEHIDEWAMTEKSMPVNYFNTKVNVASCEGVNNALNQEWYDRYVPYVTEYHAKCAADPSITWSPRNTMEFPTMGVVFLLDRNQTTTQTGTEAVKNNVFKEIPGYVQNPYYKMYAICNMGNSKKNKNAFSDPSNPYDVIMEVTDNQSIQQQMTGGLGDDVLHIKDDVFVVESTNEKGENIDIEMFEWRNAPKDNMRDQANQAWLDLVRWFAANNPNDPTNAALDEPETYGPYTFKGYKSSVSGYEPEVQVLKGHTITQYAGTYTTDTYNRRMAKMLKECEDHLIMDEIVFHYLFIERHALIDNVAKNTFWHTEDLQHWSMIKDYDNDTADGNDNSGYLTLTYGYEVLDHIDHDNTKSYVFNASSSVWLHFINGLLDARTVMYQYLDNITTERDETSIHGAWKAEPYLAKFNAYQSALPERVWIEDYYRKYLRPYEVYKTDNYLNRLAGGKKTHQRKQFEVYQQNYMASEYFGSEASSSIVDIRANGTDISQQVFPMTMYADCYIRIAAGSGQLPNVRVRAKRGQTYNIQLPVSGDANDMTTYFFLASYITSLKNVEHLKPKTLDINAAYRLREFSMKSVGSSEYYIKTEDEEINNSKTYYKGVYTEVSNPVEEDFYSYYIDTGLGGYVLAQDSGYTFDSEHTTYLTFNGYQEVTIPNENELFNYYEKQISDSNLNLIRASFINNRMLETLELVKCPNIINELDLRTATNLKYLDIQGSGFPIILIADNAPVTTMKLNNPQNLTFNNLLNVSTFSIEGELNNNNLAVLNLNNIDNSSGINSKDLVNRVNADHWLSYNLQGVQWQIDDSDELEISENNYNIKVLNSLLTVNQARLLSGTLVITGTAYNEENSLDIYNKYSIDSRYNFPNLDIQFTGNRARLYEVIIKDGNGEIIWKKKTKGNYLLNAEFLSTGPFGAFNQSEAIKKSNTESQTFTFANSWTLKDLDSNEERTLSGENPYDNVSLTANILLTPNFTENVRKYTINFYDGDGNKIQSASGEYDYGTLIENIKPATTPTKDDSLLDIYKTYTFLGYAQSPTSLNPISKFTDSHKVNHDYNYYAIFSGETSVNDSVNVNEDNFEFTLLTGERGYRESLEADGNTNFNISSGYSVKPAAGKQLAGKITIPANHNGLPVIELGDFRGQTNIKGIFFEEGTSIRVISSYACASGSNNLPQNNLQYFEFPDSLRVIGASAFLNCRLKMIPKEKAKESTEYTLGGNNVYWIQSGAFNNSIDSDCSTLYIPSNVIRMENEAFSYPGRSIQTLTKIILGRPDDPSKIKYNNSQKPIRFNYDSGAAILAEGSGIDLYIASNRLNNELNEVMLKEWLNPFNAYSDFVNQVYVYPV